VGSGGRSLQGVWGVAAPPQGRGGADARLGSWSGLLGASAKLWEATGSDRFGSHRDVREAPARQTNAGHAAAMLLKTA
jgi:hypothetical protein